MRIAWIYSQMETNSLAFQFNTLAPNNKNNNFNGQRRFICHFQAPNSISALKSYFHFGRWNWFLNICEDIYPKK